MLLLLMVLLTNFAYVNDPSTLKLSSSNQPAGPELVNILSSLNDFQKYPEGQLAISCHNTILIET